MSAPQGLVAFANMPDFVSASMTLTQGISPSACQIETPPLDKDPYNVVLQRVGNLTWTYGSAQFSFKNCIVDKIEPVGDSQGKVTWRITVLDRRWLWKETGTISGDYNTDEGDVLRASNGLPPSKPSTKKLRDLIKMCLTALGEDGARYENINGGDTLFPEVKWDYQQPATALADLCDRSNNIVVLGLDDVIRILPRGTGADLPLNDFIEAQSSVDPPEAPQSVVIVSAPVKYQLDLRLQAVGKEVDGTVKPIRKLSYAPTIAGRADWSECDPFLMSKVEAKYREIAKESVWRWYQVLVTSAPDQKPVVQPTVIKNLKLVEEILPLLNEQVEKYLNSENEFVPRPPWVYGRFSPLEDKLEAKDKIEAKISNQPDGLYTGSFSVDTQRGIVQFQSPVILYEKEKKQGNGPPVAGLFVYEPEIFLRIACNFRPNGYEGVRRAEYFATKSPGGSKIDLTRKWTRFVIDEAVKPVVYYDYEGSRLEDTTKDEENKARKTWDTVVGEYLSRTKADTISYAGIYPIACDGAIAQVTWTIGKDGSCTTRASKNREESFVAPAYTERRVMQRLIAAIKRNI